MFLAKTVLKMNDSEAVRGGIFDRFLIFDNCQLEVASDVISGVDVDQTCMKGHVKFGGSRSKRSRLKFVLSRPRQHFLLFFKTLTNAG